MEKVFLLINSDDQFVNQSWVTYLQGRLEAHVAKGERKSIVKEIKRIKKYLKCRYDKTN